MKYERYDTVVLRPEHRLWIQCKECRASGNADTLSYTWLYERAQHIRILPLSSMRKHERKHPAQKSLR